MLGIAKKKFHGVILDIIRRKRHETEEVMGGCAETLQNLYGGTNNAARIKNKNDIGVDEGDMSHYTRDHWASATTEALKRNWGAKKFMYYFNRSSIQD